MMSGNVARVSLSRICRECRVKAIPSLQTPPLKKKVSHLHPSCRFSSLMPLAAPSLEPIDHTPEKAPWRIVAAVCVQRMPTISRGKTALELRYEELKDQTRLERSKRSDFELEELKFERVKEARIKKAQDEAIDDLKVKDEEADDFEDLIESRDTELQEFKPASRQTESDRSGDMKSLERKLDRVLYLLVKKPRQEHAWQMPQGGVEPEESLIEAATREFVEECGSKMDVAFYSPAPLAVLSYKHPPYHNQGSSDITGSKVFFLKAFYRSGELQLDSKEVVDHVWVTKEEMTQYVSQQYYNAVQPILIE